MDEQEISDHFSTAYDAAFDGMQLHRYGPAVLPDRIQKYRHLLAEIRQACDRIDAELAKN